MASGFGNDGGPGRCFPFWQEVLACYVVNTSAEDDSGKKKCSPALEDYYECLHHKKEVRAPMTAWTVKTCSPQRAIELTHILLDRLRERWPCRPLIERPSSEMAGATHRQLGRYGIWAY
ncbi:uncharacterized protein B0I36DRAFT_320102 [Microdochium trichocladiopsis]|uniref:NADH dehydrogenase [ubiquinone] iron-sulfur protein 5 n=1 Tax=Microdochium trichocladiopsis TaxID=1682393 RepID=A0A9P8Y937_9PEZI|nr:uncharacterized protein B0I36DRAFT_320102 [Microdochium trichocladiopsis]KAH7032821.1 hypothetical protein B0I36DRAFT_320102 [Microdochium trichocladiopsis]